MFVIAGVSGNTGSVVAKSLLEKGERVRVIVRDAKKGAIWKERGADVAVLALDDEDALTRALEGAKGAYLLSPPSPGSSDLLKEKRAFVDALARAVDRSKIPHVVFLSSIGAQHDDGTGIIRTVAYAERRLAQTSAKLTFVRAAYFLENWGSVLGAAAQGKLPTFLPPDLTIPMVATADIGRVAATALLEGASAKTQILELAGPRDYSSRDVAIAAAKVLGKPVEADGAPLAAVVPAFTSFGISADVAEQFRAMYAGIIDGTVAFEGGSARLVRGAVDAESLLRGLSSAATPAS
ncbi:MAG: NmrA family NAD(P)-binding protein [Labilithrix sp.]|nr:NmrA family NAD(P)-binding protein [Labilithrix sp.]